MDKYIFTLIVTFTTFTCSAGDEGVQVQVLEIRQARDKRHNREDDHRIDLEYYDPDGYDRVNAEYRANNNAKYNNRNVDVITQNLIEKLRNIISSKYHNTDQRVDDLIYRYKDLKNDNIIEDVGKIPVVIVTNKKSLYHIVPQRERTVNYKVQPALRSINFDEDIDDRTARPGTKILYEYEYD